MEEDRGTYVEHNCCSCLVFKMPAASIFSHVAMLPG